MLNEARFTDARRSLYVTCLGVVMTLSGWIGPRTIARFGMRGHTTLQNAASAAGFTLTGSTTSASLIFAALPVYAFAMERGAAVRSLAVGAAAEAGMGKGEFAAAMANLRAIAVAVAPLLYASAYAAGIAAPRRQPGRPYYYAAVIAVVAEVLHRTLSRRQLRLH